MADARPSIEVKNRRAGFDHHLLETHECGIVLTGSEIKSIRAGGASIAEAYCTFIGDELYVRNMQVNPWMQTVHYTHEPKRDRKLLLKRRELDKLKRKLQDVGMTIVPVRLFIAPNNFAKLEIALAKGKKAHDKREALKAKDLKRELERDL